MDPETGVQKAFFGVSGKSEFAYFHPVQLQVVGLPDPIRIMAGFTDSAGVGAIVGQADFFQNYQVKFERFKERIEIKPRSSP
jgi:hypothetical protein